MREQQRQGFVQVLDRQRKAIRERLDGVHSRQATETGFVECAIAFYFHHLRAAQGLDQFAWCAQGDYFPLFHDRDSITKALRFIHVVSRQEDSPALGLESLDESPK